MRSKLFVPASRPELFAKAMAGEADAISFDLEDAVDESRKDPARRALAAFLGALEPGHDVKACAAVLAKAERRAGASPIAILANIETPRALRLAAQIAAASPRVAGLQAGWAD